MIRSGIVERAQPEIFEFLLFLLELLVVVAAPQQDGTLQPLDLQGLGDRIKARIGLDELAHDELLGVAAHPQRVAAHRVELIGLAFDAASAMPVEPHIKTRSRTQEEVIEACLELGLPRRALGYAGSVADWRRGAALAAYAAWCAERGLTDDVDECLARAEQIARHDETATKLDWRRDRIRVRLAEAYLWLGDDENALIMQADLVPSEAGKQGRVMAARLPDEYFDAKLAELDAVVASAGFDTVRNVILNYTWLFDRFYADPERRALLQQRTLTAYDRLPLQVRLEATFALIRSALEHGNRVHALELVEEATIFRNQVQWLPEEGVAWTAELAGLRHLAGDPVGARLELQASVERYEQDRERTTDIWRAGTLRPVAEAWAAMGDADAARATYARALDEGFVNPNAVPRAEDLVATCLSMAVHDVTPDDALWSRMREIRAALGDPW